jgi:hypothetical protein
MVKAAPEPAATWTGSAPPRYRWPVSRQRSTSDEAITRSTCVARSIAIPQCGCSAVRRPCAAARSWSRRRQVPERVIHVHLKDVDAGLADQHRSGALTFDQAVLRGLFTPLGRGAVDIAGVIEALERNGFEGWHVLEQVCYGRRMVEIASRELRNRTRVLLDRVAAGEHIALDVPLVTQDDDFPTLAGLTVINV